MEVEHGIFLAKLEDPIFLYTMMLQGGPPTSSNWVYNSYN